MKKFVFLVPIVACLVLGKLFFNFGRNPKKITAIDQVKTNRVEVNRLERKMPEQEIPPKPVIAAALSQEKISQVSELETNALSGKGTLIAGETEAKICNENLSPASQVYLTAEEEKGNLVLFVKRKVPFNPETQGCSHFIAALQKPLDHDLEFRWWIIN